MALQGVAASAVCRLFDSVTDRASLAGLEAAAEAGALPRPIA